MGSRSLSRRSGSWRLAVPGMILFGLAGPAAFGEPTIDRIEPPAARAGTSIDVKITGSELDGAAEVFFEQGGITCAAPTVENDKTLTARLTVPADCPLGPQRMRVRTSDGLSELRMFHVHASEQAAEQEPNDSFAQAAPLERGRAVWGAVKNEDVDVYKVHLQAGDRIAAVIDAVRLDQQMLDPHIELVDAEGFVVAACDDHPLLAQDAALAAVAPREGDYFLRVRESAYGGGNALYVLHVGDFPIPHVAWPPGGPPGATLDVEWFGDPAGPFKAKVTLPPEGSEGLGRVRAVRDGRTSAMSVPFRITTAPVFQAVEPNDEPEKAAPATAPVAIAGRIDASEDVDWIRVEAPKGTKWKATGWGRRLGSPVDLVIAAHRANDKRERITSSDDADGPDSVVQVTVPDEGAFLLRVNDFERRGGPEFIYWIDVEPIVPRVTVSVPPAQTKTQQRLVAAVPRGNRTALVFNAARTECGDPVRLEFSGLPAGVAASPATIADPAPNCVVVFEAAADAAPATTATPVRMIRGDGESAQEVGSLRQGTDLVFGEPNRTSYRTSFSDRLAVAVVEEAPASIECAPPATPIARRGTLDLKVTVHRVEGYAGRVRLEMPFRPPGIGASAVEVKESETEVAFPITCAGDAPLKEWQLALTATLVPEGQKPDKKGAGKRVAKGMVVASRPLTLAIVEPLVEMTAEKAVVEQGGTVKLAYKAAKPPTFTGTAKARLVGLPNKVEAPTLDLAAGTETLEFPLTVAADAPPGKHENIICRIEVPVGDAIMIHQMAATSLRIDKPLPPAVAAAGGATP
ncbi:MAG: hypothetical protein ACKOEM_12155 [Planctomycetia bacterium]